MTLDMAGMVGTVVGPISDRSAGGPGGAGYIIQDFPYDFAIGGLPFLVAPNPQRPYQRATAAFRKDQFDASQTPGDQSLTGWWLRSQFSFHGGAGIRFEDAISDDTIAVRYYDASGIFPWTPGQVTLSGAWTDASATRHGTAGYMIGGWDGFDPVVYYVSGTDSKLYSTGDPVTPISTDPCGGFAPDPNQGGSVFYLDGSHIKRGTGTYDSSQSDSTNFSGLWWAHGRLIAVDVNGLWYTFPAQGTGVAQASTDAFWPGDGFADGWVVSDSPGAIYLARARTVYKVTLADDGSIPVLAAPAVAAELPDDEVIVTLAYYLGFLVIVTDHGVRIGLTDTQGDIQYGPIIVEFVSSSCRTVSAVGSRVYVTGKRPIDTIQRVFCIDLAQPTEANLFAYTAENAPGWGSDPNTGVAFSDGLLYSYSDNTFQFLSVDPFGLSGSPGPATTGFLETGYIRLGTIELKAFNSLRVKLGGTEGSVAISVVQRNGVATQIANLPASDQADYDVDLKLQAPVEYIALRFTLIAGPNGNSPILYGYQLRALPAPRRTRMIQVPLLCFDRERAADGLMSGGDGWAFERLSTLEQLEEAAATILFQDFRTGEQGLAFIEQLAFDGDSPPTVGSSGFGGIVTATLRKVS